jgi:hypothetical protein
LALPPGQAGGAAAELAGRLGGDVDRSTCVYALDLLQISMRMKLDDQKEYPCAVLHVFTVSPVASSLLAPFFSLTRPMCMIQGSDPTKTNTWNSLRPFPGPFGVIPSVFLLLLR